MIQTDNRRWPGRGSESVGRLTIPERCASTLAEILALFALVDSFRHGRPGKSTFSIGFAGKIFHLNVKRRGDDNTKFSITSMSEGGQTWDDPEWKVVKGSKKSAK